MINFNVPPFVGTELNYVQEAIASHKICGDGQFTKRCSQWLETRFHAQKVLLTTSGSTALDMAALLCGIKPGDEVILPSFTFSSTANSFVLAGAKLVFVDIRPDTMNLDESKIEAAITEKTRVIVPVHYAGVDFGCYSFHETKNYSMGEGGALVINNPAYNEAAEILREKGTNRAKFFRGQVDKYTWVDFGDSYLPSELNAAYLWGQLEQADAINQNRLDTWHAYHNAFRPLAEKGLVELPTIPDGCIHNAHMYYLKLKNLEQRTEFIAYMKEHGVGCTFHYVPLHSAPAGLKFGRFHGEDKFTTSESDRLVRLPMYYGMANADRITVIQVAKSFLDSNH